jgi:hypothetical protein
MYADGCNGTVVGSELLGFGSVTNYGLLGKSVAAESHSVTIRDSYLAGSTRTVLTTGDGSFTAQVVFSQLDGGPGAAFGSSSQGCTAVTYNSGGSEAFEATLSSPCP